MWEEESCEERGDEKKGWCVCFCLVASVLTCSVVDVRGLRRRRNPPEKMCVPRMCRWSLSGRTLSRGVGER